MYFSDKDEKWNRLVKFFKEKGEPVKCYEDDTIGYPIPGFPLHMNFTVIELHMMILEGAHKVPKDDALTEVIFEQLKTCKNEQIDILSVSLSPVHKNLAQFKKLLLDALENDCEIRIVLADPASTFKRLHPQPEEFDSRFAQVKEALAEVKREQSRGSLSVWTFNFPLYNSTYRFGGATIVVPHLFNQPSSEAPVCYLGQKHPLSTTYQKQFEQIVDASELTTILPLSPKQQQIRPQLEEIDKKIAELLKQKDCLAKQVLVDE